LASVSSPSPLASSPISHPEPIADDLTDLGATLIALENAIDGAFALSGRFAVALTEARRARNLSAVVGQPIFDRAARAMAELGSARGEIVGAHRSLEALARQLGIDATSYGDGQDKPPAGVQGEPEVSRLTA
jgi:hypothetical protein